MKKMFSLLFIIFIFFVLASIFTLNAARSTPIEDIMSNNTVSAQSNNNLLITAQSGLPANASITIVFPSAFSSINTSAATINLTGGAFSVSGNTITITTTTPIEAPGFQININGITAINPATASSTTTQYIINFSDTAGDSAGIGVVIIPSSGYGSGPAGDKYEQAITINSTNTNTLTNYQVEVTLNTQALITAGQMQTDCADIRFTDSSGNLLQYWLEGGCNTSTTQIWVKIPSITASANTIIYLYYGSPNAVSTSNGGATFNYFDQGNSISNWVQVGSAGQITSIGDPSPSYYTNSIKGDYMYENIGLTPNEAVIFNGNTTALGDFYFLTNSTGAGQMYRFGISAGWFGFATTNSWTSWNSPGGSGLLSNTWYKFEIAITSSTSASLYYKQTTGDSPLINGTLLSTNTIINDGGYIGLIGDAAGTGITYWDNIIVRQYSSPEPTTTISSSVTNLNNNQVELTLNVTPYITFGVSSNSVNLGIVSYINPTVQNNTLSLTTNATNGANITVQDQYAGLYNSLASYTIPSITETLASGIEGYGINANSSNMSISFPFSGTGDSIGGLSISPAEILSYISTPIQSGSVNVNYIASASNITPTGIYSDNITFIATGNF